MSGVTRAPAAVEGPRAAGRGRWAWAAGTVLAGVLLMFCYLRVSGATQVNSDGAGLVLEAQSVLHGNLLLHGWWATDVTFYTTEVPEYVVVTALSGVRPEVVHICSALTYTLVVLLAAWVARGRARGAEGVVRALLAGAVILAPQPDGPTQVLLGSPDHIGSAVPILVLLLLLDWARARWWVPVAAGVLLAWSIVGDPLIEVAGAAPLALACLIRAARLVWPRRRELDPVTAQSVPPPRAGESAAAGQPWSVRWAWSTAWYELSLGAAAVASVFAARAASAVLVHLGGVQTAKPSYRTLPLHEIISGLPLAARSVLALFGADYIGARGAGQVAFALVHLIGVAVVLAAAVLAAWRLVRPGGRLRPWRQATPGATPPADRPGDLIADFLVLALAVNFAAFLVEVPKPNIYTAHEIGPVLGLGAALAGRVLGGPAVAAWRRARVLAGQRKAAGTRASWTRLGRALLPALAAGLACYMVLLAIAVAHPQAPPRNVGLTQWLTRHHLRSGLAPYWEASSVTVDSGGAVQVLAVTTDGWHGHLAPQKWQTDVQLPAAGQAPATFVVISPAERVTRAKVVDAFGQPDDTYRWGPFQILTWKKNLLPDLAASAAGPRSPAVTVPPR